MGMGADRGGPEVLASAPEVFEEEVDEVLDLARRDPARQQAGSVGEEPLSRAIEEQVESARSEDCSDFLHVPVRTSFFRDIDSMRTSAMMND